MSLLREFRDLGAYISQKTMQKFLERESTNNNQKLPKSLDKLCDFIEKNKIYDFSKEFGIPLEAFVVKSDDPEFSRFPIFTNREFIKKYFRRPSLMSMDGTFGTKPNIANVYQVFTMFGYILGKVSILRSLLSD